MTKIYLCRHGETDHNRNGVLQGQKDTELNERGERQAEKLAERLAEKDLDAVYSSDLDRASSTAERVAERADAPHIEDERLRERSYGVFEGSDHGERKRQVDEPDDLDGWKPEGGETLDEVRERASDALTDIEQEYPGGTVVIVAHGWTNRALLTDMMGAEDGRAHSIKQGNTTVNELEKDDYRGWRVHSINDTSHLQ